MEIRLQRYGLLHVREKTRLIKSVWFEKEIFHAHNLNPFVINPTALEIITKDNNLAKMIRDKLPLNTRYGISLHCLDRGRTRTTTAG